MQQFIAALGGQVSVWYVDEADGRSMERPALQNVVADAASPERGFDVLVIHSWSKLCRSVKDSNILISLLRNSGAEVVSVSEPYSGSSVTVSADRLTEAFKEYQREVHRQRTRLGIAYARLMRRS